MKRIFKYLIALAILVTIVVSYNCVNAANGSFSVSVASSNLTKGKTTSITITAKNCGGQFSITSSNSKVVSVSTSSEWVESGSKKITITAKGEGTAIITVKAQDVADTSENEVTGSKTVTIRVTDSSSNTSNNNNDNNSTTTKSSNANLKTLGITGKSLEYNFKGLNKDKEEYEATKAIPSTVDSIQITAIAAEKKAKIKISGKTNSVSGTNKATGNIDLEVGTNPIKIVVTAPDGKTTKLYSIRVTKLATEDDKPGNVIDDEKEVDLFLKSLSIDGLTLSPEFSSNVFTYETTINMDENDLNEVKVNAEANNSNAKIEITGNTNLVEGENLINIIVKEEGTSNQTVYQITVNKVSQKSEVLENSNKISKEKIIIAGGIAVIIIVIAVWIIIMKKNKDSYYDYEENDEEQEDTLYNYDNDNEDYNEPYSQRDNLVEELFQKKNKVNNEELNIEDKKTLEEIQKENDRIFKKNVEDESENSADEYEKRKKGKHF